MGEEVRGPTGCVAPGLPLGKSGTAMFTTVLDYTEVMRIVHLKVEALLELGGHPKNFFRRFAPDFVPPICNLLPPP